MRAPGAMRQTAHKRSWKRVGRVWKLLGRLPYRYQTLFHLLKMMPHRRGGSRKVALGNCPDDPFMVFEAVVVSGWACTFSAQPPPHHGATDGV